MLLKTKQSILTYNAWYLQPKVDTVRDCSAGSYLLLIKLCTGKQESVVLTTSAG